MSLKELEDQLKKLSIDKKLQLVKTLLSSIQEDTITKAEETEKIYPLRGLPITISDDFDEPMTELWESLAE